MSEASEPPEVVAVIHAAERMVAKWERAGFTSGRDDWRPDALALYLAVLALREEIEETLAARRAAMTAPPRGNDPETVRLHRAHSAFGWARCPHPDVFCLVQEHADYVPAAFMEKKLDALDDEWSNGYRGACDERDKLAARVAELEAALEGLVTAVGKSAGRKGSAAWRTKSVEVRLALLRARELLSVGAQVEP